jgi:hypothetical protein
MFKKHVKKQLTKIEKWCRILSCKVKECVIKIKNKKISAKSTTGGN